ncbi:MAG: Phosphoribosylamine--glycine ligase [Actinobacteria bacterium ADurb.Bin346]|nr:MAG: Phosphoribosylamine--glycine ligase [Actinobacteria bacterium ADurb.Bin346]
MKVLIIGSGGREHCLAWKLASASNVSKIYAIPGNPGIAKIGQCINIGISGSDFKSISDFVFEENIDFTIVGPEAPLVDGIVDFFQSKGQKIFGPDKSAARLEGSKVFTKELCVKYGIPTAGSIKFNRNDYSEAVSYIKNLNDGDFPVVIKVDGLAAGKGVIIPQTKESALDEITNCFINNTFGSAADSLIIEEFIEGFEVSLLNLCDGRNIVPMALAQDYKKIFDGDRGKNTGGMGSYSPVPFVDEKLFNKMLSEIIYPSYEAIIKEGINYRGVLYGGIIVSKGQPYLLEYNCRFGDPETQAILPNLNSDLLDLMLRCSDGKLGSSKCSWRNTKCVCVVLASQGYPETSSKNDLIEGLDCPGDAETEKGGNSAIVFHAGTISRNSKIYTNGGRVLGVVASAESFKQARKVVYEAISNIRFEGMQFRRDIAKRVEEEIS